jgi:hypothetical protein
MIDTPTAPGERATGWRYVSKRRAFFSHLALSATVVGLVCGAIFLFWYPAPYFTVKGTWNALRVLVGVDLILGPLLTLILFRPGKPGLALDMTMIALIQVSALLYGATVIYTERPYYAVFAIDRFEVLAKRDVAAAAIAGTAFTDKPLVGPILAFARLPSEPEAIQRLIQETLFEGKPDIDRRPELWRPFDEERAAVLARARPLSELAAQQPAQREAIDSLSESLGEDPDSLAYVPVIGTAGPLTMVIDGETARPIAALSIDPWAQPEPEQPTVRRDP